MCFSKSMIRFRCHPSKLGEHTIEVLAEIGYDEEDIAELEANDII